MKAHSKLTVLLYSILLIPSVVFGSGAADTQMPQDSLRESQEAQQRQQKRSSFTIILDGENLIITDSSGVAKTIKIDNNHLTTQLGLVLATLATQGNHGQQVSSLVELLEGLAGTQTITLRSSSTNGFRSPAGGILRMTTPSYPATSKDDGQPSVNPFTVLVPEDEQRGLETATPCAVHLTAEQIAQLTFASQQSAQSLTQLKISQGTRDRDCTSGPANNIFG